MAKKIILILNIIPLLILSVIFNSCSDNNPITQIFSNDVAAKDRLDSANAQAIRKYGPNTKLVLIFGKNVKSNGKTDISTISLITSPDSIGAWMYIYRSPIDSTSLKIYTPDPVPGASDCWELTSVFNTNIILNLITDTSARNIVGGALSLLNNSGINITTPTNVLINSDASLSLTNSTNPIIRFDSSFHPGSSSENGNAFFSDGTNQTRNMFLVPAAGTLNLPAYIQNLTGFPNDLWIVNYKKTDSQNRTQNLILGTVVLSNQTMSIPLLNLSSKVINLSKYSN